MALDGAFNAVTFHGTGQKFGSSLGDGMGVMGSGYSKAELARYPASAAGSPQMGR